MVDDPITDSDRVRNQLADTQATVGEIAPLEPSFDDIFVKIIEANTTEQERADS